jgi:serpin B
VDVELLSDKARAEPSGDAGLLGDATLAFGAELFAALAAENDDENVIISPTSVAIALAMLEPGAVGEARRQLQELLRIDDADAFHAAMNALEQSLEAREVRAHNEGEDPGDVVVRIANAAYLQQGYPFEEPYLDTIGTHYGPVVYAVDFEPDPDAVAHEINRFVADATRDRIAELLKDGDLRPETVFALVNALYLKASWLSPFDKSATRDEPFTRLDGREVTVPMMHDRSDASARGDGWIAAQKRYVGDLAVQFILPDEGRFDDVAADLPRVVAAFNDNRTAGATLAVPRFETRFGAQLTPILKALGLTAPYLEGNLTGMADDPRLVLDVVAHQTFVAMDEEGTEAAAATVATGYPTSAPAEPPVPVVLDRPFLFRIFDVQTGATLFLGRVLDPTR